MHTWWGSSNLKKRESVHFSTISKQEVLKISKGAGEPFLFQILKKANKKTKHSSNKLGKGEVPPTKLFEATLVGFFFFKQINFSITNFLDSSTIQHSTSPLCGNGPFDPAHLPLTTMGFG